VPTPIIVGEHDIPDVHAHSGAIAAGISGARRVIVQGSASSTSSLSSSLPARSPDEGMPEARDFRMRSESTACGVRRRAPTASGVIAHARCGKAIEGRRTGGVRERRT